MRGGGIMRKSKVKKMKLASLLLLSTVLIPNIAYADEEIDESVEAETTVNQAEIQDAEQTINEQEAESEKVAPDVNNNDIDTNTESNSENVEEEAVDNSGGENEESAPILQPAEPEEQPADTPAEPERNEETAQEDEETEVSEGEEEPPSDESDNNEADLDNPTPEEEPEMPVLPTETIEPVEPETPAEPNEETTETVPEQEEEIPAVEQPSEEPAEDTETNTETSAEESVEQDQGTLGTEPKKLYRYDYGDILNGISFSEESLHDDLSTLDQRVSRVISSKIIEEKDLTKEQKLELEEKVKADTTNSYEGEELPNTGEADSTNYAAAGLLTIFGAILVFMSKKLKTDN